MPRDAPPPRDLRTTRAVWEGVMLGRDAVDIDPIDWAQVRADAFTLFGWAVVGVGAGLAAWVGVLTVMTLVAR